MFQTRLELGAINMDSSSIIKFLEYGASIELSTNDGNICLHLFCLM